MKTDKIKIRLGTENDKQKLLNSHHGLDEFFFGDGRLVIAKNGNDIVGFLWAHKRKNFSPRRGGRNVYQLYYRDGNIAVSFVGYVL